MIQTTNPATGEHLPPVAATNPRAVAEALEGATRAWCDYRNTSLASRADLLRKTAAELRSRADGCAKLMAREMGKPVREGRSEVEKCASVCEYYAEQGPGFLTDEPVETDAARSYVSYQPLGVLLAIMPWNFPFWQVFRFAAPALMAGNAVLLKHAANVPRCSIQIAEILRAAGFPPHIFSSLLIDTAATTELIGDARIAALTLTGSTRAGRAVAEAAGAALKKVVLELGGSDPYVVLADADLEHAAATCVRARLVNGGQSCIAAKRFIVSDPLHDAFAARVTELMSAARLGDPLSEQTEIGPQARVDLRDDLHRQVCQSVARGARLRCGGSIPSEAGAWYPATVLTEVAPGMPAYHDELFGPVAAVIRARDTTDAIRIANDTAYGLGAAVFTTDLARGREIAQRELQAGYCAVNTQVRSDPRVPFGGIKASGYGRELSRFGIREFVNIKTVVIDQAP